jgi:glyoxylase-like metal-dependent hydrolase (beta-lactamase superfamily II)
MHTPGHTPACMTYVIGDAVFVGDTLFMPDFGTARCDFPGGDARHPLPFGTPDSVELAASTIGFSSATTTRRRGDRRVLAFETTVAEERVNIHVHDGVERGGVREAMREARDATLGMPNLILPSLQVNMRAGHVPPPEDNGQAYIKIPINAL